MRRSASPSLVTNVFSLHSCLTKCTNGPDRAAFELTIRSFGFNVAQDENLCLIDAPLLVMKDGIEDRLEHDDRANMLITKWTDAIRQSCQSKGA